MEMPFKPNEGKNLTIDTDWGTYARFPVKTHVVMKEDVMNDILDKYVMDYLEEGDMIFISEKIVAITQGRALEVSEIKVSRLAKFLVKFVHKSEAGIGIGDPSTMELCLRDCGRIKVLFAAVVAGICKIFGKKGVFYNILGMKARAIDGPSKDNVPPYDHYAKMAPENPDGAAADMKAHAKVEVVIVDANDFGCNILGRSSKNIPERFCQQLYRDNPHDQGFCQTPLAIVRKAENLEGKDKDLAAMERARFDEEKKLHPERTNDDRWILHPGAENAPKL